MKPLRSYVKGSWVDPQGEGAPLLDAANGQEVARIGTVPMEMASVLEYGREVGGPALRETTF
jgi:oxepin-CoA hydrolase/3-oxo-5,6-dehydrosuberyl-CoA semialdehyde dehydrogenase